jgi:hypothetical protein
VCRSTEPFGEGYTMTERKLKPVRQRVEALAGQDRDLLKAAGEGSAGSNLLRARKPARSTEDQTPMRLEQVPSRRGAKLTMNRTDIKLPR